MGMTLATYAASLAVLSHPTAMGVTAILAAFLLVNKGERRVSGRSVKPNYFFQRTCADFNKGKAQAALAQQCDKAVFILNGGDISQCEFPKETFSWANEYRVNEKGEWTTPPKPNAMSRF